MSEPVARTYRFTWTGNLTIDDMTLRTLLLGAEFRPAPGEPEISEEETFHRQLELVQETPLQLMEKYLRHRFFADFQNHVDVQVEADMPGCGLEIHKVRVEEDACWYPIDWKPVRPEDR